MTMREIAISVSAIQKRKKQEMIFQAKCMGAKIEDDGQESSKALNKSQVEKLKIAQRATFEKQRKGNGRLNHKNKR